MRNLMDGSSTNSTYADELKKQFALASRTYTYVAWDQWEMLYHIFCLGAKLSILNASQLFLLQHAPLLGNIPYSVLTHLFAGNHISCVVLIPWVSRSIGETGSLMHRRDRALAGGCKKFSSKLAHVLWLLSFHHVLSCKAFS